MANGPRKVVDEVERVDITLALAGHNRPARCLIAALPKAGVIHARDRLDVIAGSQGFLHGTSRSTAIERLARRHLRAFGVLKERQRLCVGA